MCGIWAYIENSQSSSDETISNININENGPDTNASRGPDKKISVYRDGYTFIFHRLAIHDLSPLGDQPFVYNFNDGYKIELMCNGEIYNYKDLIHKYDLKLKGTSDCEIIGHLIYYFNFDIIKVVNVLRGEFAFIAFCTYPDNKRYLTIARDTYGVRPLYYGITENGIVLSSLLGGIINSKFTDETDIVKAYHFPPGYVYHEPINKETINTNIANLFKNAYTNLKNIPLTLVENSSPEDLYKYYKEITDAFINAVKIRLDSERPIGFLLSGGLDSSLIVAVGLQKYVIIRM
jgi:asparagine synthase (glutamine-hydrolysing)